MGGVIGGSGSPGAGWGCMSAFVARNEHFCKMVYGVRTAVSVTSQTLRRSWRSHGFVDDTGTHDYAYTVGKYRYVIRYMLGVLQESIDTIVGKYMRCISPGNIENVVWWQYSVFHSSR